MATSFSSLPIVSLAALSKPNPTHAELDKISCALDNVFSTTGFAYLTDLPLSFDHGNIFSLCDSLFNNPSYPLEERMELAKKSFVKDHPNTYRGYFPPQPGSDNLKEGFDMGPIEPSFTDAANGFKPINLVEPNVWPSRTTSFQPKCEKLYSEMQSLARRLLCLLATALGEDTSLFAHYFENSISTLRFLHYPRMPQDHTQDLICTPHTDSGILTLLHQDTTGGLEVRNGDGDWIPAPYIPGSIVVNIGDLMARVSNGRYIATLHRVRAVKSSVLGESEDNHAKGRYSVPFFFEPGPMCVVKSIGQATKDQGVVYSEHVLEKMKGWIEFQDLAEPVAMAV